MDITGQFFFATLLALSQFIEPYSAEQKAQFLAQDNLLPWQIRAYEFEPKNPEELMFLSNEDLAHYYRTSCLRLMTEASLTPESRERGHLVPSVAPFVQLGVEQKITEVQESLLSEEQQLELTLFADPYATLVCESSQPIEEFHQWDLRQSLQFFMEVRSGLPSILSQDDLPQLSEVSHVYDKDNQLLGDYSQPLMLDGEVIRLNRRRLPEAGQSIPLQLKQALVSVEDIRFWNFMPKESPEYSGHQGVDLRGLLRAATADRIEGGSTLTMQLVKNLLLIVDVAREQQSGRRSIYRKLREYMLAHQIEQVLSKDEILDWYLNTIDFGRSSQGIVLAAQNYFGKELDELAIHEMAFLAALPKAPYGLDPRLGQDAFEAALARRNIILDNMYDEGYFSPDFDIYVDQTTADSAYDQAYEAPLGVLPWSRELNVNQGYAIHYVDAVESWVTKSLREAGAFPYQGLDLVVPMDVGMQAWAVEALQRGLLRYERSRYDNGQRAFVVNMDEDNLPNIQEQVMALVEPHGKTADEIQARAEEVFPQVLQNINHSYLDVQQFLVGVIVDEAHVGLKDGRIMNRQPSDRRGNLFKIVGGERVDLEPWDTVLLQEFPRTDTGVYYRIASMTAAQGAVVVIDNETGEVLATAGRFSVGVNGKNRGSLSNYSFNAFRQPGSTVKPFAYLHGLLTNASPGQVVSNADIVLPALYEGGQQVCDEYPFSESNQQARRMTVSQGLIGSRNRLTLNMFARTAGFGGVYERDQLNGNFLFQLDSLHHVFKGHGLYQDLDRICHNSLLGTKEVHPVEMAAAYSTIINNGYYQPSRLVSGVLPGTAQPSELGSLGEDLSVERAIHEARIPSRQRMSYFQLKNIMQGVIREGTASSLSRWSNVMIGKTGTTDDYGDTWFVGATKKITVAVWVGYPEDNRTLGRNEDGVGFTGAMVALPIFEDFMENYFERYPEALNDTFESPEDLGMVALQIEATSGWQVTSEMRSEVNSWTGRSDLQLTTEYFPRDQRNRWPSIYPVGTLAAAQFLFNSMTAERRASYEVRFDEGVRRAEASGYSSYEDFLDVYQRGLHQCRSYGNQVDDLWGNSCRRTYTALDCGQLAERCRSIFRAGGQPRAAFDIFLKEYRNGSF